MNEIVPYRKNHTSGIIVAVFLILIYAGTTFALKMWPDEVYSETFDRKRDGCRVHVVRYSNDTVRTTVISCPQDGQ